MGDREEDRSSLSLNAWIAIAVGVVVVIVVGLHVPVYLTYRHEQKVSALSWISGGRSGEERHGPPWPMSVLADRWKPYGRLFDRVSSVTLGPSATDAYVVHLAGLTELQELGLNNTEVTDAGLVHLAGLTKLKRIDLSNPQVTDAGLAHLAGLTKLKWMDLSNTQVTDAGLVHLAGLAELYELTLNGTQVSDAGAAALKRKLPRLRVTR